MTTRTWPHAIETEKDVLKASKEINTKTGKYKRVHVGKETVRQGQCTVDGCHRGGTPPRSSQFEGVVPAGWVFWCSWGSHYFVNLPPKDETTA